MSYLLDTHVWLWSLLEPERLSAAVLRRLSAATELWISPISVWEVAVLSERKRLDLGESSARWVDRAFATGPFREAALTRAVALAARTVEVPHQDPADRFLAATAVVHDLTLVTADRDLLRGRGFARLACR